MNLPSLGRLGVDKLAADHWHSLVEVDQQDNVRTSVSDVVVFYAAPAAAGLGVWIVGAEMTLLTDLLAGIAIITGLLFGVLTHVLSLGLRIADDARLTAASRVTILTDELRANVSYGIGVGVALTTALMLISAFGGEPKDGYPAWLSGLVVAGVLHLMLTLLMILKRVRSTYKMLGK
jgi:hypothetical protein